MANTRIVKRTVSPVPRTVAPDSQKLKKAEGRLSAAAKALYNLGYKPSQLVALVRGAK